MYIPNFHRMDLNKSVYPGERRDDVAMCENNWETRNTSQNTEM